jgi:2'-5' RNA ligase
MAGNWFVALAVPGERWLDRVPDPPDGVRVFHAGDLHVTVAFLGACGEAAAMAAFELAPEWPADALDATLGRVEPMGNPRRPNAFAAIVEDGAAAVRDATLAVRERMCARAGARTDERAPKPHVTIARPRRKADGAERRAAASWAAAIDLGAPRVRLERLVLYTHSADRAERLFREHATYGLDGR